MSSLLRATRHGPAPGPFFEDYLVCQRFEGGPVVTLAAGVEGGLGPVEVGVVLRCGVR